MGYQYSVNSADTSFLVVFFMIYLVFFLALVAFGVIAYVFHHLGMYTIAKRRGIHHPWLTWIPVGSSWILGSISDQYRYVTEGRICNRRKTLLGLSAAAWVASLIMIISYVSLVVNLALYGETYGISVFQAILPGISALIMAVLSIVCCVFQYIAYYDLFKSCKPDSAIVYLLVSIFTGVTLPFFVYSCRKKDDGMPPRRRPAAPFVPQNVFQPSAPVQPPFVPVQQVPAQTPNAAQEEFSDSHEPAAEQETSAQESGEERTDNE